MKARHVILIIVLSLLVLAGLGVSAWLMRPTLIDIFPQASAENVPVTSQIRLVFSRPMDPESVISHIKIEPDMKGEFNWDKNILVFTPDQTWPGGKEISLRLEAGVRAKSWLAFPMEEQSWSFTTSVANLAYLWPSNGPADIYALNPLTGEIQQYTQGMGVLEFTTSSDGLMIYFSASTALGESGLYQIGRIKAANSTDNSYTPRKLLDCESAQCRSPAVSMDGKSLAFEYILLDPIGGLGPAQIWILNLQSLEITPLGQPTHETVQPAWSPTSWLAYYDRTRGGYEVINPQTGVKKLLPNRTGQPGSWSPDGEFYLAPEITYFPSTGDGEIGASHLLRYRIKNGLSEEMSGANDVEDVEGNYSPEGGSIAFGRKFLDEMRWTLGRQIWIMNPDGSNPHPITNEADYNHYDLAWSRDGRVLAYVRFNQAKLSDPPELWMVNMDGSNPVRLVIGGYSPLWIP